MAHAGGNNGHFLAKLSMLDETNYDRWLLQMKVIFCYQEVQEVVRDGAAAIGGDALREQQKKDSKAIFLIYQCVDPDVFEKIAQFETAKEAWGALAIAFAGDNAA